MDGNKFKQIQNLTAIRTPSHRLTPIRESLGSHIRPTQLTSLSPLPALFSYCQKNLPPTSHFCFSRQTTRFPLSTGSVATGFSAATYYSRAPEPDPNSPDGFTHEDPNPNVKSLRESSVGIDDGREDIGEGLGRRRTLPEGLSSTVVVLTCMSKDGTSDVFLLGQGSVGFYTAVKDQLDFISICGWSLTVDPTGVLYDRACAKVSCEEVRRMMNLVKPEVLFLELCHDRLKVLENPHSEFHVAFKEAEKYNCKVVYGDRDHRVTIERALDKVPLHKRKDYIRECLSTKRLPLEKFPEITDPIIKERDIYMTLELNKYAGKYKTIVGVVGGGHLPGMEKCFRRSRMPYKMWFPFARRQEMSARVREKHPNRIPLIIYGDEKTDVPNIVMRKLDVRADVTVGQLVYRLQEKINPSPEKATFVFVKKTLLLSQEKVTVVFVKNTLLPTAAMMSAIYEENKDEDGFLYLTYSGSG